MNLQTGLSVPASWISYRELLSPLILAITASRAWFGMSNRGSSFIGAGVSTPSTTHE